MNWKNVVIYVLLWGGMLVAWNYGYSAATPFQDVVAAVVMLFITKYMLRLVDGHSGDGGHKDDDIQKSEGASFASEVKED